MARKPSKSPRKNLKYVSVCKGCQLAAKSPTFHKRVLNSKKFFPSSKDAESLRQIALDTGLVYKNFVLHVNKHVAVNPETLSNKEMDRIIARNDKKAEVIAIQDTNRATDVWDDVIGKAREELENGSMKLTANHLLKAAKDKSDFEIKKKNQDMAIQEMMWHFASGEALNSGKYDKRIIEGEEATAYDPTQVFAGAFDEGAPRSGDLHPGTTGDAPTPGPGEIPPGDDF